MRLYNLFRKQRLRLGLLAVLLAALAGGFFAAAQAQARPCKDLVNITACGDRILDLDDGFQLEGNVTIGPKGGAPVIQAVNGTNESEKARFNHNLLGDNRTTLEGDLRLINDPTRSTLVGSRVFSTPNGGDTIGQFFVDPTLGLISNPAAGANPIVPPEFRNAVFAFPFIDIISLRHFPQDSIDALNKIEVQFDLKAREFRATVPFDMLLLADADPLPVTVRVTFHDNGSFSGSIDGFKARFGGMIGTFEGIKLVPASGALQNAAPQQPGIAPQQNQKPTIDFEVDVLEFALSDNPGLPNLDASNPSLVFSLQGVQYKDGRFGLRGGAVSLPDWQVGSAFKLSSQKVSVLTNEAKTATTLLISSTLSFPTGSVATDARTFPMAIRVGGKELPNGSTTAAITGTLLTTARPALNLGPLSIATPTKTELIFDPSQNFFGLKADQVTLRWGADLGSGAGVQTGFKLGMDKDKKLVFGIGAGGAIKLPDIRSKALTMQLSGSLASANDVTTFSINGIAKLALPSNGAVSPGVTMTIRGGKNVRDICVGKGVPLPCFKRFEYKLSSFELKLAGFGIGLTNAQGTDDGGFAVDKATLTVPAGIKSIGGSISGFKITGDGDVSITGGSVELPPLQVGSFSLVGVKGTFVKNTTGYEFKGAGTVPLPGLDPSGGPGGKKISGEVIIRTKLDGSFQGFGVTIEFNTGSPGIPIANTGMELVSMRGAFDVNAGTIKIAVGMRASTTLRFATLPAATVEGNAELQLNPFKLTANAKLSVLVFNVAQASMGIGHQQGFAGGSGFNVSFSADLLLVHGSTSLRVGDVTLSNGQKKTVIAATALYRVGIKKNEIVKFIPPVDVNFASVEFEGGHFRVSGGSETLGLMGRVKVNMPLFIPDVRLSVFVDMRGPSVDVTDTDKYTLIEAATVRARAAQGLEGYSTRMLGDAERRALNFKGDANILQETIPVVVDRPGMTLFGISYPQGAPRLRLRLPNGSILTEQTIDRVNSGFLRHAGTATEEHQLAFILNNAQPGAYTMIVDNAPAVYDKVSYRFNVEPTVGNVLASCGGAPVAGTDVNCGGDPRGPLVSINWTAQDTDSPTATVRIGYVPAPANGGAPDLSNLTTLAEGLPLGDGTFTWDVREAPTGRYQLVVSAEDGQHQAARVIAPTVIDVTDRQAPAAPSGLQAQPLPGELLMTWTPNREKDLAGYEIGFGVVQPGVADSPARFIYSRDMGAKQVVISASNVLDARLWGLTDDQDVFVGIRAYDLSGNVGGWSPLLRAKPWALAPKAWTPAPNGVLPTTGRVEVAFAGPLNLDPQQAVPAGLLALKRADGSLVAGRLEPIANFDGDKVVGLRFVPAAPLRDQATYTVVVKGGATGVTAADGRQMAQDYSWSFRAEARSIFLPLVRR